MRGSASREIALSGISAALALIAVTLGGFIDFMTLSFNALAGVFIMMPLTKGYWKGAICSYIVVSIIGFFIHNVMSIAFIVFFGAYAIIQWLLDRKFTELKFLPKWALIAIAWIIKLAYYQFVVFIVWRFMGVFVDSIQIPNVEITYLVLTGLATVFCFLYDILMYFVYKNLKWFVEHKLKK